MEVCKSSYEIDKEKHLWEWDLERQKWEWDGERLIWEWDGERLIWEWNDVLNLYLNSNQTKHNLDLKWSKKDFKKIMKWDGGM